VRFLAMTMPEQARHCSFGLTKTFFFRPSKVRFLAMTMPEQARHCSFGLTKTFFYAANPHLPQRPHNGLGAGFTFRHVLNIPGKGSIVVPCIALRSRFDFIWHLLLSLSESIVHFAPSSK